MSLVVNLLAATALIAVFVLLRIWVDHRAARHRRACGYGGGDACSHGQGGECGSRGQGRPAHGSDTTNIKRT